MQMMTKQEKIILSSFADYAGVYIELHGWIPSETIDEFIWEAKSEGLIVSKSQLLKVLQKYFDLIITPKGIFIVAEPKAKKMAEEWIEFIINNIKMIPNMCGNPREGIEYHLSHPPFYRGLLLLKEYEMKKCPYLAYVVFDFFEKNNLLRAYRKNVCGPVEVYGKACYDLYAIKYSVIKKHWFAKIRFEKFPDFEYFTFLKKYEIPNYKAVYDYFWSLCDAAKKTLSEKRVNVGERYEKTLRKYGKIFVLGIVTMALSYLIYETGELPNILDWKTAQRVLEALKEFGCDALQMLFGFPADDIKSYLDFGYFPLFFVMPPIITGDLKKYLLMFFNMFSGYSIPDIHYASCILSTMIMSKRNVKGHPLPYVLLNRMRLLIR